MVEWSLLLTFFVRLKENTPFADKIRIFFYGCLMGISDAIPGVSGATIALILGIYEKLIKSISYVLSTMQSPLDLLKSQELKFLVNLYLGVFFALFLVIELMNNLINNYQAQVFSFFVGLIAMSIYMLSTQNRSILSGCLLFIGMGILTGGIISSVNTVAIDHSAPIIFISGFFAFSAMILPGISGSYVLLMLNQYQYLVGEVSEVNISVITVFTTGVLMGLCAMSKFLNWLLKKYHDQTITFLIGLMIGGLGTPIKKINGDIFSLLFFGAIGAGVLLLISRFSSVPKAE